MAPGGTGAATVALALAFVSCGTGRDIAPGVGKTNCGASIKNDTSLGLASRSAALAVQHSRISVIAPIAYRHRLVRRAMPIAALFFMSKGATNAREGDGPNVAPVCYSRGAAKWNSGDDSDRER